MKLNLITCNIRFDNPADGNNSWAHRRDFLSQLLLSHRPDIIGTQEGRHGQLKDLESLLKDFQIIEGHRSWIEERMYPSLFIRKERFHVLASGDSWLSETPQVAGSIAFGSAFPRLMTWVKLEEKTDRRTFFVFNTHLDHVKSSTRVNQVKVLIEEMKKISGDQNFVLLGDFNDSPASEVRQLLLQSFPHLVDAWKIFHKTEETSHHAFKGELQNGHRIDWILLNGGKAERCFMDKSTLKNLYPTDHFPVICELTL